MKCGYQDCFPDKVSLAISSHLGDIDSYGASPRIDCPLRNRLQLYVFYP